MTSFASYEHDRVNSAAGDARKAWQLYKEVLFNHTQGKKDSVINIQG